MSDTTSNRKRQDFETVLDESDKTVASFERETRGVARTDPALPASATRRWCRSSSWSLSVADFRARLPATSFFSAFNLSLIMQQVSIIGILAAAQSLVILTAGIDLSVARDHGADVGHHGQAGASSSASRHHWRSWSVSVGGMLAGGLMNGLSHHQDQTAALHHHAGHLEHLLCAASLALRRPVDPRPGHRRRRADAEMLRRRHRHRRRADHLWRRS